MAARTGIRVLAATAVALALALLIFLRAGSGAAPSGAPAAPTPADLSHDGAEHAGAPLATFVSAPTPAASTCGTVEVQGKMVADSTAAHRAATCFQATYALCAAATTPTLVVRLLTGTADAVHYALYAYTLTGTPGRCAIDVLRTEGNRAASPTNAAAAADYEETDRDTCSGLDWDQSLDLLRLSGCGHYATLTVPLASMHH
ncbi:MAG TPA: hypothetical protein VIC60_14790 [Thermomicrobiales bacterium]|jgi:hypothetical protein